MLDCLRQHDFSQRTDTEVKKGNACKGSVDSSCFELAIYGFKIMYLLHISMWNIRHIL